MTCDKPAKEYLEGFQHYMKDIMRRSDVEIKDGTAVVGRSKWGSRNEEVIHVAGNNCLDLKKMTPFEMTFAPPGKGKSVDSKKAVADYYSGKYDKK